VVHFPGEEMKAAHRERARRCVHRVAHVQDQGAGDDRQLLVLGVPVRRDLVTGGHLEPQREGRLLRRIAVQHRELGPLREVGRRRAPLELGGIEREGLCLGRVGGEGGRGEKKDKGERKQGLHFGGLRWFGAAT
jgi:hypothetical protein